MEQLQLVTEKEVSSILSIPLQTLRNHRSKGCGLPYHKLGRSIRYSVLDVEEYLSSHKISTTDNSSTRRGPWEEK